MGTHFDSFLVLSAKLNLTPAIFSTLTPASSVSIPRSNQDVTIECRYPTNLNATRFAAYVCPYQRYMFSEDVIDERGFVDGVKVSVNRMFCGRQHICVLKKQEHRLKAEPAGLKTLIVGLIGGSALVQE